MLNRRSLVASLAGVAAVSALAGAEPLPRNSKDVWGSDAEVPNATVIRGKPNVLDFGNGLKIPFDKHAFLTLWEGPTFWLTYGFGCANTRGQADEQAVRGAEGTMQVLLLTLAFAPERLEHADGGWRLKVQDVHNYIQGYLELPGKPFAPMSDPRLGFGNLDDGAPPYMLAPTTQIGQGGIGWSTPVIAVSPFGANRVSAFTNYIVKKKDVDLDTVRAKAKLVKY